MSELLWVVLASPFMAFLALLLLGAGFPRSVASVIGAGASGLSAAAASVMGFGFITSPPAYYRYGATLWTWVRIDGFNPSVSIYLDPLSLVMVLVITWVGFLILLYSTWFMADDEGYPRFFAYMNLFVGSMLVLVLAGNFLLLYAGWEGVGLCSYLLIGFWYRREENVQAAFKAFIVTRIGDATLLIGLFLIFHNLGTLDIQQAMAKASSQWTAGSLMPTMLAALLLGGALAKSAQLPLQTWLPDAMAGPTPVSALIHAATMVTAGVYLIARTHVFFELAPAIQLLTAIIGAVTLLVAGSSALVQQDIKRVLAYSTMSQVGYMFLALGVGAWIAAIYHFLVHACFKALLFLSAGVIIRALGDEHDIIRMGGLRKKMPLTFITFLIGTASLSAVPFLTGGYYSKDLILSQVWASPRGGSLLLFAGLAGGLLTSIYGFRLFFRVFFGEPGIRPQGVSGWAMTLPLVVLAIPALVGGLLMVPSPSGETGLFPAFMRNSLPSLRTTPGDFREFLLPALSSAVSVGGIFLAYLLVRRKAIEGHGLSSPAGHSLRRFLLSGWGFDRLYGMVMVRPFVFLARVNKDDLPDLLYAGMAWTVAGAHRLLAITQSGNMRWYAMAMALGAVIFIGMVILL